MRQWDKAIFEELISDNQFISWVREETLENIDHWNNWKKIHPDQINEFDEAIKTVKTLKFRPNDIHQADIQYLWNKTSERINQSKPDSRYRRLFISMVRVAAILTLPLFLVTFWLYFSQNNLEKKYTHLLENKIDQKVTVIAPIGARIMVDLPDGSKAWLNSGSELSYPIIFNTNERRISLTGEAYFKVKKSETPFFVSSLGPEIKVYGTEFNVNSYSDEEFVTVALAEGKISQNVNGREAFIVPGQVSVYDKKSKRINIENTDVNLFSSWREGKYIFRNTPLSSILRILQRQHNVTIHLMDPELGNCPYNMSIKDESLEQILQLLSISAPLKYNFKQKFLNADGSYTPDNIEISADKTRIVKN